MATLNGKKLWQLSRHGFRGGQGEDKGLLVFTQNRAFIRPWTLKFDNSSAYLYLCPQESPMVGRFPPRQGSF
jgi:hypothetical protein